MRPRQSTIAIAPADPKDAKYKGVLFLRCIPETTKIAFKAACATTDHTMRDVMILLMRKYASAVQRRKPSIRIDDFDHPNGDDNQSEKT